MRGLPIVAFVVVVLAAGSAGAQSATAQASAPPAAARPHRSGFTFELGLGAALTLVNDDVWDISRGGTGPDVETKHTLTKAWGGVAPLSFGLGGFVTENVALLFRAAGTSYFKYDASDVYANAVYGPAVQVWTSDRFFWGAALGLGIHGESSLSGGGGGDLGVAAELRAGYAFFASDWQVLRVGGALVPGVYDGTRTLGVAATLDWQLL
jgi:hypothetical protein